MGKYRKQLNKTFTIISIVLASILILSVGISYFTTQKNQRNQYLNTLKQSSYTKTSGADMAMTVIIQALRDLIQSSELEEWASAQTSSSYYYSSLQAYNHLRKITTDLSLVDYDIAITLLDDTSFVISNSGTVSKNIFFTNETSLTDQQVEYIFNHFKQNRTSLVLPSYNGTQLERIYYIISRRHDEKDIIYMVNIPYATLFGRDKDQEFILYDQEQILAYSNIGEDAKELADNIYTTKLDVANDQDYFKFEDKNIFTSDITSIEWKIAYIHEDMGVHTLEVLVYIIFSFVLIILMLLAFRIVTEKLYSPIKEVILDIAPEDSDSPIIDEFQILKQTTNEIKELSQQLEKTILEKDLLVSQRFYRNLLFGFHVDQDVYNKCEDKSSNFCVALIEFQNLTSEFQGNDSFFHKNVIYSFTLEHEKLQYVNISPSICAIIVEADTLLTAKNIIVSLISAINEEIELKVAISDIRQGIDYINNCYKEALEILDYKHLYGKSEIITMEQVADLVETTYYYPLLTENRLIQNIIEGKPTAIEIFDDLIRENIQYRNLAPYTLKNFLFVLIGTLNRSFQELKTTPEELLGQEIDFEQLYNAWNNVNIISQIKEIIQGIITKVSTKNSNIDDELLSQMLNYIYQNYSDDIMLNDMAARFNISPKYCSALFKRLSDDTFKNFLNKYRIEKSKEFLEKDPSIKIAELSTMVGFNSSNSFIRVFRKYTGLTPKAFADKIKGA